MCTAKISVSLAAALTLAALPILAHHPFSQDYDQNKPFTVTGVVTEFDWDEPHTNIELDVKDGEYKGMWHLQGADKDTLKQSGWSEDTLPEGSMITVHAYRAKDGSMKGSARSVVLPDGKTMIIADAKEDGGPDPAVTSGQTTKSTETETAIAQAPPRDVKDPGESPRAQVEPAPARAPADRDTDLSAQRETPANNLDDDDALPQTAGNLYTVAMAGVMALSGAYFLRRRIR